MGNQIEDFYLFLDVETTGKKPGLDEVCEVASILTDLQFKEVSRFDKKIQFTHSKMTAEAQAKNGYDSKIWAYEAVPFYQWQAWLGKHLPFGHLAIPVGHNVEFDWNIIFEGYYKPNGKFFPVSFGKICTLSIARTLRAAGIINVPDCKLETVCEALKIKVDGPQHAAWPDMLRARAIFDFHHAILKS